MFKITRDDLRKKTNGQLAALFNQVNKELKHSGRPSQALHQAQSALKLIHEELSQRPP